MPTLDDDEYLDSNFRLFFLKKIRLQVLGICKLLLHTSIECLTAALKLLMLPPQAYQAEPGENKWEACEIR